MTIEIEEEVEVKFDFDWKELISQVVLGAIDYEHCPYEAEVSVLLTDNEGIHKINNEFRHIDRATDVLSFPMVQYEIPGDFSHVEEMGEGCFNPETGELLVGDIIISVDKVYEQADAYQHSVKRELAFLVAHSMLHLFGYDHMEEEERLVMESRQRELLNILGITRE
jgi:probable rRNA maturation factor